MTVVEFIGQRDSTPALSGGGRPATATEIGRTAAYPKNMNPAIDPSSGLIHSRCVKQSGNALVYVGRRTDFQLEYTDALRRRSQPNRLGDLPYADIEKDISAVDFISFGDLTKMFEQF